MRNFAGVVVMSVMLLLAACGGDQKPVTKTYTSSQTITIPAGVSNLTLLTGQGGTGSPSSDSYVEMYSQYTETYNQRNDAGGFITTSRSETTYHYGSTPSNYCGPTTPYVGQGGVTNYTQTCYFFADASYWNTTPATTGGTTEMTGPNGFNRSWVGGTGGPATSSTVENVAVVAGGQYTLSIPSGGSITISYYE